MGASKVAFSNQILPYLLLAPQLVVTAVFFLWPAGWALYQSFFLTDAFGGRSIYVGLENYVTLLDDPLYTEALIRTIMFASLVAGAALGIGLTLAVAIDSWSLDGPVYEALLTWPYAVAAPLAAVLWLFVLHPSIGLVGSWLVREGIPWDYRLNGGQAFAVVVLASIWKQISYNFIFFLAGLQAIPRSVIEAAAIDGAGAWRTFRSIQLPLLSPTVFFLVVVNIVYAFFDSFGVIHALTAGGPGNSTETLIYRVYVDGHLNHDFGRSSAQSVVLLIAVITLTSIQFRFIQRRVHYS